MTRSARASAVFAKSLIQPLLPTNIIPTATNQHSISSPVLNICEKFNPLIVLVLVTVWGYTALMVEGAFAKFTIICCCISTLALWATVIHFEKELEVAWSESLNEKQNVLREDVNRHIYTRERLTAENEQLQIKIQYFLEDYEDLKIISEEQKAAVSKVLSLSSENRTIFEEMRNQVEAQMFQELFTLLLDSNKSASKDPTSGSYVLTPIELEIFMLKLSIFKVRLGNQIMINDQMLLRSFKRDLSLKGIFGVVKDIMDEKKKRREKKDSSGNYYYFTTFLDQILPRQKRARTKQRSSLLAAENINSNRRLQHSASLPPSFDTSLFDPQKYEDVSMIAKETIEDFSKSAIF